ncbi:hypothetical protein PSH97_20470 [Pseudomonas cucumis]|uniref:Lipoprotein n=1 Tax=Pseudomonas cucumis TaxID=2954082 RepID=A0ABY9ERT9_9PSED|nr:hypothetical protein [Pseudomonas cucumis]WLG83467.1 hypothetical protein PSH97_20470 [Pseudomonas cucumis]
MKVLFTILAIVLCVSCAKPPVLPSADIRFISISNMGNSALFDVRFSSKTDLLSFFKDNTGEGQLGEALICSLDKIPDFVNWQDVVRSVQGEITEIDNADAESGHVYLASMFVTQTKDVGVSSNFISTEGLLTILEKRDSVLCKFFTSAYSYGPYYSNVMNIPASEFIRVVKQKRGL